MTFLSLAHCVNRLESDLYGVVAIGIKVAIEACMTISPATIAQWIEDARTELDLQETLAIGSYVVNR